jgi:hypothetical protein
MRTKIRTYKIKATDTGGEGVAAYIGGGGGGPDARLAWDYAWDTLGNHTEAAKKAAGRAVNWTGEYTSTGYVFVVAE